jgi:hypothetical protein
MDEDIYSRRHRLRSQMRPIPVGYGHDPRTYIYVRFRDILIID